MTDADDALVDLTDLDHVERLFEDALAASGEAGAARMGGEVRPVWVDDLADRIAEARGEATADELVALPAVVTAMTAARRAALHDAAYQTPIDGRDEPHTPRHAAPAPAPTPAGRQVRRVLAVKGVAFATAVAVGTVAAAAATTGIVSNVVDRVTSQQSPLRIGGAGDDGPDGAPGGGGQRSGTADASATSPRRSGETAPEADGETTGSTAPQPDGADTSGPDTVDPSATATTDGTSATTAVGPADTSTGSTDPTSTSTSTTVQSSTTTSRDDSLPAPARENRNDRANQGGPP